MRTALLAVACLLCLPALAAAHGDEHHLPNGLIKHKLADGTVLFSHGGDAKSAAPHGTDMDINDPQLAPVCAAANAQQVLYARPKRAPDRYASVVASLRGQLARNTYVLDQSAKASGGSGARYRVVCDAAGQVDVKTFVAKSGGTGFNSVVNAARSAGYNRTDVDYTIFYDAVDPSACGVGSYFNDERGSANNLNNNGGAYAVVYSDCWYGRTSMHENGHNEGAVQPSAPHSTGSGAHCNDLIDVMCYAPDGGNQNQTEVTLCSDTIWFDCNFDTYFDAAPEAGEWLVDHWNIGAAYNRYITLGP
jgi:hypothetical protein